MAFDRLIKRIDELHNPSVAGLDPRLEYVPQFIQDASFVKLGHTLEAAADAILQFNKALIDALYDVVPAIKPQAAYYEMYGWAGVRTLAETIRYAPPMFSCQYTAADVCISCCSCSAVSARKLFLSYFRSSCSRQ